MAFQKTHSKNIWNTLFILTLIAALSFVFLRLFFGIDFLDEAFFIAMPYRFLLGDKPFVDELIYLQLSSLLNYPLIKAFHLIQGNLEGSILFLRFCFFLFSFLVAGTVYYALKPRLGWQISLLVSVLCFLFIPGNVPSPHYKTLGSGLFVIGIFLTLGPYDRNGAFFFIPGLFHGIASIAHPLFFPGCLVFAIALYGSKRNFRDLIFYLVGGVTAGIAFSFFFSPEQILHSIQFTQAMGYRNADLYSRLLLFFQNLLLHEPFNKIGLILLVSMFILFSQKRKWPIIGLALLLPLLAAIGGYRKATFLTYYVILGSVLYLYLKEDYFCRRLFWLALIPAIATGIAASAISYGGGNSFNTGLTPAIIVVSVFIVKVILFYSRTNWRPLLVWIPLTLLITINIRYQMRVIFETQDPSLWNAKITQGPYKGIYTTSEKSRFIKTLTQDLKSLENPRGRIYFHPWLPAGYLMTSMRPNTPSIWECPKGNTICPDYLKDHLSPDDLVVMLKAVTSSPSNVDFLKSDTANPYMQTIREKFEPRVVRNDYEIYTPKIH